MLRRKVIDRVNYYNSDFVVAEDYDLWNRIIKISKIENIYSDDDSFPEIELAQIIEESINSLPEKRREIFRLSRQDGLKYQEIADKLNISVKTVETQITLALKTLRDKLKNYSTFFTLF